MTFTDIYIIFNPNSTGPSKANAENFAEVLKKKLPEKTSITLKATAHAGHGEKLAQYYAKKTPKCLIVSSSGDGGYHDIINGVILSGSKTAVTCLLPSGNANDHYNSVHNGDVVERIKDGKIQLIDLLRVDGVSKRKKIRRYAHSYVGIGLTPHIGRQLNKTKLNRVTEALITINHLFHNTPVKIEVAGRKARYQTLVCSNIGRMAKVMSLSKNAIVTDGKFELNGVRSSSLFNLLRHLFQASTVGLQEHRQLTEFKFTCLQNLPIQMDGEISKFDAGSSCVITCEKQRLACIV